MELVANFLTEQFEEGREYSTLNGYRSAISAYHAGVGGVKIGQHALVTSILTGFFNRRPQKPKYTETWDVAAVLKTVKAWGPNTGLSLKKLSLKTTMLMALSSASRVSELASLDISYRQDKGSEILFSIPGLTKGRRVGQPALAVSFKEFPEDPVLDVYDTIKTYIRETHALRRHHNRLLISYQKPHTPVAPCSVARWLKETLQQAGIDTDKFKAHSTRGAATSKAAKTGLSAKQIIDKANWKHASTFRRFYYRECEDGFQKAVFSG